MRGHGIKGMEGGVVLRAMEGAMEESFSNFMKVYND